MSHGWAVAVRELWSVPAVLRAPRRSRVVIERRVLRGVRQMVGYARQNVPFYADAAYDVPIDTLDDLARLPLLRKDLIRARGPEPFHAPWSGWFQTDATSGSTGRVLRVRHDAAAYGYHGATIMRRFRSAGYRPWWTIAQIKPFPRPGRWFQRLGVFRRVVVAAGQPDERIKDDVLALAPNVIMAYPVMLRMLLRTLSEAELARLRKTLRLVFTDSELVTEPVRALFAQRFGVPVCDEYSAYEVLTVGSQCRYGSMHIDEDRVYAEFVDDDGRPVPDGLEGAVVVTHYRERAMPLVRYWLGDRAIPLPAGCECGSNFRRMMLTRGRSEDFVQLPGDRRIYIGTFLAVGKMTPGVDEFMVRQADTGAITISIVTDPRAGLTFHEIAAGFRTLLTDHLGIDAVGLDIIETDRVELGAGGKAQLIRSHYRMPAHDQS